MTDSTDIVIKMARDAVNDLEKSIDTCDPKVAIRASLAMGLTDGLEQNKKISSEEASKTRVKIESLAWNFADKCSCTSSIIKDNL